MHHLKLYSLCLAVFIYSFALAGSPADHDIPTLVMRTYGSEASLDVRIGWIKLEESAP